MDYSTTILELRRTLFDVRDKFIGTNFDTFPYDYFYKQTAEEDNADTDLYFCSICKDDVCLTFIVDVLPSNKEIKRVGCNSNDIIVNSILIADCIDMEDETSVNDAIMRARMI